MATVVSGLFLRSCLVRWLLVRWSSP